MRINPNESLLTPASITRWLIERPFIWEMKLFFAKDLCEFAADRGLIYSKLSDDIQRLWQIGLLRADLVISKRPLETAGLVLIKQDDDGDYLYADERSCVIKDNGLSGSMKDLEDFPPDIYLMFHPFRYYVLYRIEQKLELRIASMTQILRSPEGYQNILRRHIERFDKSSLNKNFIDHFRIWNEITSLAIAAEPFTYSKLFGVYSIPYNYLENEEEFHLIVRNHFAEYKEILTSIGLDKVREIASELCREAEMLEPNKDMHLVLRLTERDYRLKKVKGRLGGSIYLLAMAEMIRRSAEKVFETELPEEDEMGFSWEAGDYKDYFYGAQRLTDNHKAKSEFLRDLGLHYNVRLRWYVEGDTELNAIRSELGYHPEIEIINLRGNVIARQGKGLSFRENLLNDMNRSVYSWVSLDGDVEDNLRVLKKAVENNEMFGMFYISKPDFEFANFTLDELVEILWEIASENGAESSEKQKLVEQTSTATTGKELFKLAKQAVPALGRADKGSIWGEKLMRFALKNHQIQQSDGSSKDRLVIESIYEALHAIDCNYYLSRKESRVDVETGKIVDYKNEKD
jgi:hypothetical protein